MAATVPSATSLTPPRAPLTKEQEQFYRDMAATSWAFMQENYRAKTGLVQATRSWGYTTIWDLGGQLIGYLSAKELGLISPEDYAKQTSLVLNTMEKADLFRGAAYNKVYSATDGSMGTPEKRTGSGWSATDLGRFLVALKIIATREPSFAAQAERVARRIDFKQTVKDGYMQGQLIGSKGTPWSFQEGRIGYEQYSAAGFNFWGAPVQNALNLNKHAKPISVLGVQLLGDTRKLDRLVSEPFFLYGLELGMPAAYQTLAMNMLKAQEARYKQSGHITMASEDAVSLPPAYFYYYCVYCNGKPFVVDISSPGKELDSPRWVSTKAAFAWDAIMPSDYTAKAAELARKARSKKLGWASGLLEGSNKSTETYDINTAAVLLEVAAFQLRGGVPLIQPPAPDSPIALAIKGYKSAK